MKHLVGLVVAIAAVTAADPACASDAHIELTAYEPTSCSMTFSQDVVSLSTDTFSLGSIEQFCNTNYQLTLLHASMGSGAQFRFGDRVVNAGSTMTVLLPDGHPVIGSKLLLVSGVDRSNARTLGGSLVLQVTPLAL
jgi:hypothetical protein